MQVLLNLIKHTGSGATESYRERISLTHILTTEQAYTLVQNGYLCVEHAVLLLHFLPVELKENVLITPTEKEERKKSDSQRSLLKLALSDKWNPLMSIKVLAIVKKKKLYKNDTFLFLHQGLSLRKTLETTRSRWRRSHRWWERDYKSLITIKSLLLLSCGNDLHFTC